MMSEDLHTFRNRGKQSSDDKLFASKWLSILEAAVDDICFLLSRGYAENSAQQIVGNRYKLNKRQRNAVLRISCSQSARLTRSKSNCKAAVLSDTIVEIDGFNLLILLENALSDAYIFKCRDGLYRDISSVHGSYKRVTKTDEAIHLIGSVLNKHQVKQVKWYLDKPVSNSGRLKTRLLEHSKMEGLDWAVELVYDPDKVLAKSQQVVITSDGWILDHVNTWFNLGAELIEKHIENPNVIEV